MFCERLWGTEHWIYYNELTCMHLILAESLLVCSAGKVLLVKERNYSLPDPLTVLLGTSNKIIERDNTGFSWKRPPLLRFSIVRLRQATAAPSGRGDLKLQVSWCGMKESSEVWENASCRQTRAQNPPSDTAKNKQWCVDQSHESSPQEMLIRNTSAENDFRVTYIN